MLIADVQIDSGFRQPQKEANMKTRERLLLMALGGLLVLSGMVLGQKQTGLVQAEVAGQEPDDIILTVTLSQLHVKDWR